MPKITKFYLDKASYLVGDETNFSVLAIDYRNNKFSYSGKMRRQVTRIAKELLARKHNINFADKIVFK